MQIFEIFELPPPSWKLYGKTKNVTPKKAICSVLPFGGGGRFGALAVTGCFCYNFSLLPSLRSRALLRSAHASFTRFTMEVSEAPQQLPSTKDSKGEFIKSPCSEGGTLGERVVVSFKMGKKSFGKPVMKSCTCLRTWRKVLMDIQ